MFEEILKQLTTDLDSKTKLSRIKEVIICYCVEEKQILNCYRTLKHLELDLLEYSDLCNDKEFVKKILKIIETELDILNVRMRIAQNPNDVGENSANNLQLKWTDSKTDLVELIYFIKSSIGHGNDSIKHIKTCFEYFFQIKLGNIYDILNDISSRKINRTKYIDRMTVRFQNVLDQLDS